MPRPPTLPLIPSPTPLPHRRCPVSPMRAPSLIPKSPSTLYAAATKKKTTGRRPRGRYDSGLSGQQRCAHKQKNALQRTVHFIPPSSRHVARNLPPLFRTRHAPIRSCRGSRGEREKNTMPRNFPIARRTRTVLPNVYKSVTRCLFFPMCGCLAWPGRFALASPTGGKPGAGVRQGGPSQPLKA
jgi:hypothetical protein